MFSPLARRNGGDTLEFCSSLELLEDYIVPFALPDPLAPAQIVGYAAFVLGVSAFLQKNDRRLKILNGAQGLVYAVHFLMLGSLPTAGSALVCGVRSSTAAFYSARWLAVLFVGMNVAVGLAVAETAIDWLPVVGFAIGSASVFLLSGIPLRIGMFSSSAVVVVAAFLTGSIGGVALESCIAAANAVTATRLWLDRRAACAAPV